MDCSRQDKPVNAELDVILGGTMDAYRRASFGNENTETCYAKKPSSKQVLDGQTGGGGGETTAGKHHSHPGAYTNWRQTSCWSWHDDTSGARIATVEAEMVTAERTDNRCGSAHSTTNAMRKTNNAEWREMDRVVLMVARHQKAYAVKHRCLLMARRLCSLYFYFAFLQLLPSLHD